MSFIVIDFSMCFVYTTCKFFLPLSVITQEIKVLNGITLLSNTVRQNSCPLILDNIHSKFSVICVRFMYKYFFPFFNPTPFVFLKTFLVKRSVQDESIKTIKIICCVLCKKELDTKRKTPFWATLFMNFCNRMFTFPTHPSPCSL